VRHLRTVPCRINYPKETPVMDIMDLLPKVAQWVNTTSQNMGNWETKEDILQHELATINTRPVLVSKGDIPLGLANEVLQNNRELIVIGYDILQIPQYRIVYKIE